MTNDISGGTLNYGQSAEVSSRYMSAPRRYAFSFRYVFVANVVGMLVSEGRRLNRRSRGVTWQYQKTSLSIDAIYRRLWARATFPTLTLAPPRSISQFRLRRWSAMAERSSAERLDLRTRR